MPPPDKPPMQIVDYADIIHPRPLAPVDGATLAKLRDVAVRIQRRETNANGDRFDFTILKNRDAPAPNIRLLPFEGPTHFIHTIPDKNEPSCVFCDVKPNAALEARRRIREQASAFHPTCWDHLLRDEGLG